jgi:hypothetical protein
VVYYIRCVGEELDVKRLGSGKVCAISKMEILQTELKVAGMIKTCPVARRIGRVSQAPG